MFPKLSGLLPELTERDILEAGMESLRDRRVMPQGVRPDVREALLVLDQLPERLRRSCFTALNETRRRSTLTSLDWLGRNGTTLPYEALKAVRFLDGIMRRRPWPNVLMRLPSRIERVVKQPRRLLGFARAA